MNVYSKSKIVLMFVAVVAISAVTSLTTFYFTNNSATVFSTTNSNGIPATYARFSSAASALDTDFTLAAELSIGAVVHVKTKTPMRAQSYGGYNNPLFEYFFGRPQQPDSQGELPMQEGSGSGVIISSDGYIVTNNHVIDRSKEIEVTLNDKRTYKATLVGADPNTDIALIKIDGENLPVVMFGNSDSLKVGEWVLAVGNPFNLTSTVTAGIVSAKARNINIIDTQMKIESFIQTDAVVNPGNSGGALVNTKGELVGINTAIASRTGTYAGYAFAVPASIVQKVVSDIRQFGAVQRALLGVRMGDITNELAKEKNLKTLDGAYIGSVEANSAAEKAGVKENDIIIKINDFQIKSSAQLQEQVGRYSPGDKISITVLRNNKELTLKAELMNRQGNTSLVTSDVKTDVLGAEFEEIGDKIKSQFRLDYGLEVKSIQKGKLQQAGIKTGFIIVKINNRPIRTVDDVETIFDAAINTDDQFKVLNIAGVYPNGKIAYYTVNLED